MLTKRHTSHLLNYQEVEIKYTILEFQNPHFHNKAKCKTFHMKMSFIQMKK